MDIVVFVIVAVTSVLISYYFMSSFFVLKNNSKVKVFLVSTVFVLISTLTALLEIMAINVISSLILQYMYVAFLFKGRARNYLLCTFFIVMFGSLTEFVATFLLLSIINIDMELLLSYQLYTFAIILISRPLLFMLSKVMSMILKPKYSNRNYGSVYLLIFPGLAIGNTLILLNYQLNTTNDIVSLTISSIVGVGIIISGIYMIIIYDNAIQKKDIEKQLELSEQTRLANHEIYKVQEQNFAEIKRNLHDYKNNLINLQAMYMNVDIGADNYHNQLLENLDNQIKKLLVEVNNPILSNIIYRYAILCDDNNIHFETDIMVSDMGFLEPMQCSAIFDNILENAVEANLKINDLESRYISLSVFKTEYFIVVNVKNPYQTPVRECNGEIQTTKTDNILNHGYGLKNVLDAVQKSSGYCIYNYDDNVFNVLIRFNSTQK